jgi:hypothetical protein
VDALPEQSAVDEVEAAPGRSSRSAAARLGYLARQRS